MTSSLVMSSRLLPRLLVLTALAVAGCAFSPEMAAKRVTYLNREALVAYRGGDYQQAELLLKDALAVSARGGIETDETVAVTHLYLGAVYTQGLNDSERGLEHLTQAMRLAPTLQLAMSIETPVLLKALRAAQASAAKDTAAGASAGRQRPSAARHPRRAPRGGAAGDRTLAAVPARGQRQGEGGGDRADAGPSSSPLSCPSPEQAEADTDLTLRCRSEPGARIARVLLYYRPAHTEEFTAVAMTRSVQGWYEGVVPAGAVSGKSLQYYFEAQGPGARVASTNGDAASPNVVLVEEGTPALVSRRATARASDADEENPLLEVAAAKQRAARASRRRSAGHFWLGAGVGSGYGWHPRRRLDLRNDVYIGRGVSSGRLVQVTPELGYQISDGFALSIQSRHQYIPEEGSRAEGTRAPAQTANAVFLRGHWFAGSGWLQGFATATAGWGQGFRLVVRPDLAAGLTGNDTVRGGPFVLGPGLGFAVHFSRAVAWTTELRGLAGLPELAFIGEGATGLQVAF